MATYTVTERGVFKRCQRLAILSSKNGRHLTTMSSPLALGAGTIVHRAHQLWMLDPDTPLHLHALAAGHEAQERVKENYRATVGCLPSPDEMLVTYESIDIAMKMCENYALKYGTPIPEGYTLYAPEQKIRVKIPETEHTLEGKVDALLLDRNSDPVVYEGKTYDRKHSDVWFHGTDQLTAYIWLVWQLNITGRSEIPYLLYDGRWRRETAPRGRVFDDLFVRRIVTRNLAQLQEFERLLPIEAHDMYRIYSYPQIATLSRDWKGCPDCQLEKLCYSISRGEDYEALIRTSYVTRVDDIEEDAEEVEP